MEPRTFIDQLGSIVRISFPPKRIVSLVPSQTELLADLGLEQEVVGITKFCVHPAHWRNEKTVVGGTKNFNFEMIHSIRPDLILGNKEENYQSGIDELRKHYPVWMSDIYSIDDALSMIRSIAEITDTVARGSRIVDEINIFFEALERRGKQSALYLIWRSPWMAAGGKTFINSMIEKLGLQNCLPKGARYPELSEDDIRQLDPAIVFLSTEPFPFQQKHLDEIKALLPHATVLLVDGEMFSWYGSRLRLAPEYFNSLRLD